MHRILISVIAALALMFGAVTASSAHGGPPEDSRNFHSVRHGNHAIGITVDLTPNNLRDGGPRRLILVFDHQGEPIDLLTPAAYLDRYYPDL